MRIISRVSRAVAIRIGEPIGMGGKIVDDACADIIGGVGNNSSVERGLQPFDLTCHALNNVAVAVVIRRGRNHADCLEVFGSGDAFVAESAFFDLDLEGVGVVAAYAGGIAFDVIKFGVIGFAFVFVTTLDFGAVQGDRGGIVVDIDEAKAGRGFAIDNRFDNRVRIGRLEFGDSNHPL